MEQIPIPGNVYVDSYWIGARRLQAALKSHNVNTSSWESTEKPFNSFMPTRNRMGGLTLNRLCTSQTFFPFRAQVVAFLYERSELALYIFPNIIAFKNHF